MSKQLNSLSELKTALAACRQRALSGAETALGEAALIVQEDARNRIGEYQQATGPFAAWEPLADSTEKEKARQGYPSNAPLLAEGGLRDSIVVEHKGKEAVVGSNDPAAAYQEFGTDNIPPRPFLGPAAFDNQEKIHKLIGDAVKAALITE